MIRLGDYINRGNLPVTWHNLEPWQITNTAQEWIRQMMADLPNEYRINHHVAIHPTAIVEDGVVLKGPIIVGPDCFIGAHAYLRNGVYLEASVSVGPGCEIKSSVLMKGAALAHFNFVGDSILGQQVNLEAGAIIANHYNERQEKEIAVLEGSKRRLTGVTKFGALVGDYSKIGANAVLSPGTLLPPHAVVGRLELVNQTN